MNDSIIEKYLIKYQFNNDEKKEFLTIFSPMYNNIEFQKRMTNEFLHHGVITLGEHIIEDAILTYKLAKKVKKTNFRVDLAVTIAILHDLYTVPWQNNKAAKVKHFFNKHGFRHPVEAVINSITWYPEKFQKEDEAKIIIDGILHHMFPLPVRYLNSTIELKNKELYDNLDSSYKDIIDNSLKRKKIGSVSFSRSIYTEGRIMAKADRIVSRRQIKDFSSAKALLTGHNKKIEK